MPVRIKALAVAAIIAAAFLLAPGRAAEAARTFAPQGPQPVGFAIEYMEFQGREMAVALWYPAKSGPGEGCDYGTVRGTAIRDAEPDPGEAPYPLILFSHGLGACSIQSIYYTENLASFGYVVVAPEHRDAGMCHPDREPDVTGGQIAWAAIKSGFNLGDAVEALFSEELAETGGDQSYRAVEASAAIDQALEWNRDETSALHGMIDPQRIGATGHSLGGYTSLMIGGVPYLCGDESQYEEQTCGPAEGAERRKNPCCLESFRKADPMRLKDERVKAILPLGPPLFFPDLPQAAAGLQIPIMFITGSSESMEVPLQPIQTLYDNAPPPKYLIVLDKTDHMTIADMTLKVSAARLLLVGFRSGFPLKAKAYQDYSVAFFDLYLKNPGSGAALAVEENRYVNIQSEEK